MSAVSLSHMRFVFNSSRSVSRAYNVPCFYDYVEPQLLIIVPEVNQPRVKLTRISRFIGGNNVEGDACAFCVKTHGDGVRDKIFSNPLELIVKRNQV